MSNTTSHVATLVFAATCLAFALVSSLLHRSRRLGASKAFRRPRATACWCCLCWVAWLRYGCGCFWRVEALLGGHGGLGKIALSLLRSMVIGLHLSRLRNVGATTKPAASTLATVLGTTRFTCQRSELSPNRGSFVDRACAGWARSRW